MRVKSVLALVAVPAIVLAACTSGATPSPSASAPRRVRTGLGPGRVGARVGSGVGTDRRTGKGPAPAAVVPAGPVRGLLRGQGAGLLRGREPDRHDGRRRRDVIPQAVGSQPDGPEFTIAWVPKVLQAREAGSDLVDIAQVFQRSGTLSVSWKDIEDRRARASSPARRSASGTSATSSRSRPAPRLRPDPGPREQGRPTKQSRRTSSSST